MIRITNSDWDKATHGKPQPSQSYPLGDDSFAMVKRSCFENDKYFWLEHEKDHCEYYFAHHEINLRCRFQYPDNPVERHAFSRQFHAMKNAGLDKRACFDLIWQSYLECRIERSDERSAKFDVFG